MCSPTRNRSRQLVPWHRVQHPAARRRNILNAQKKGVEGNRMASVLRSDDVENQPTGAAPTAPGQPDVLLQGFTDQGADAEKELDIQLSRQVSRFGAGLNTAGDAMEFCRNLFDEQLQKAAAERPLPNVAIEGDSAARAAFLMLLTDAQQRELFIGFGKDQRAWPRIKPLVGSPPFHFLLLGECIDCHHGSFHLGRY